LNAEGSPDRDVAARDQSHGGPSSSVAGKRDRMGRPAVERPGFSNRPLEVG
jgi:hypothetical protein